MLEKFIRLFKRFAGNSRAWKLKNEYTRATIKALLSISKSARFMLRTIPKQAYPWLCDDEVIPYWEEYFGIFPGPGISIQDRRRAVVTEYVAIGSNAADYLGYILSNNDHDATILENLDAVDMGGTWDVVRFKIANGLVALYPTGPTGPVVYDDPIAKPVNERQWKKVFVVLDKFDDASVALLRRLILKYSSSHTVAMLINNDPDSTIWDAELVNELVPPVHVMDAELVTLPDNTEFVLDAELVT